MSRTALDATVAGEIVKPSLRIGNLISLAFPSVTIYVTNFGQAVTWNGNTYLPGAKLSQWGGYQENNDLRPRKTEFTLSLTADVLSAALSDNYQNSPVNVYVAALDGNFNVLGSPYKICDGLFMSSGTITAGQHMAEFKLSAETRDIYNDRDSIALCSPFYQKLRYPGDTFVDDIEQASVQILDWGGLAYVPGYGRDSNSTNDFNRRVLPR